MPYDSILELMSPPGHPDLFILGSFARRVTVYSQQVRAINVVDAIHFYRRPLENVDIAIVGGGVAGITAAARALKYGARVTLFEQNENVLSIQHNSRHRWLHPTIYDWPFVSIGGDGLDNEAQLSVMNWSATTASEFALKLTAQWKAIVAEHRDRLCVMIPAAVKLMSPTTAGYEVRYEGKAAGSPGLHTRVFPVVILAVGFGLEPRGQGRNSYWEQDPWDQIQRSADQAVLVAGYGDGGLTDLMRVCLINFEHEKVLAEVVGAITSAHRDKIKDIEQDKRRGNAEFLSTEYRGLDFPEVQAVLRDVVVKTRKVFLTGTGDSLFIPGASALNRLVVSQLLRLGAFEFIPIMKPAENQKIDLADPATIAELQAMAGTAFTDIVARFGPNSAINKIEGVPGLDELRKHWKSLQPIDDRTLTRLWERFDPISDDIDNSCVIVSDGSDDDNGDLLAVAGDAISGLPRFGSAMNVKPVTVSVQDCIRTDELLHHTVRALCRAPIAIFSLGKEMGQDNPAGMMLLGIRAAVRRGMTLVIQKGAIDATQWKSLPFNLKEIHVLAVAISTEGAAVLAKFIADGLSTLQTDAAGYRDLPVFDIVRRPQRRTPGLESGKIETFVLCSFSEKYTSKIWNRLRLLLRKVEVPGGETEPAPVPKTKPVLEPRRVIDYASPLLVGERLYELTRHAGLCVIDWTEWRANVFFELGVRLAVNPIPPICILNRESGGGLSDMQKTLQARFTVLGYSIDKKGDDPRFREGFAQAMGVKPNSNAVHASAQRNIFLKQEYGRFDALQQVESVLGADPVSKGNLSLLYLENFNLTRQIWRGTVESLKAAQLLIRWKIEQPDADQKEIDHLRDLLGTLNSKLRELLDFGRKKKLDEGYRTFYEGIDDETLDVSLLRDVRDLKRRSRRYRERDQLERAAEALQRALELMEPRVQARDSVFETAGGIASQALRDLAAELADCYGSMAGIRRRLDQLDVALDLYGKGRQLELTKAYRIGNTYNQVQWLVLQVLLRPALITGNDPAFAGEIDRTLQVLDEQVRTTRAQDPWAYSDIGLLRTLRGREPWAEEAWDEVDDKKPISDVYEFGPSRTQDVVSRPARASSPQQRGDALSGQTG